MCWNYGIFFSLSLTVSGVELNLGNMMKAKETSVSQLTSGVAALFKMNKVNLSSLLISFLFSSYLFYLSLYPQFSILNILFLCVHFFQVTHMVGHGSITGKNEVTVTNGQK